MGTDTKLAIVHIAGPWEVEYSERGRQQRVQRCLRCDEIVLRDTDTSTAVGDPDGLKLAKGVEAGAHVAIDAQKWWIVENREPDPEKEENCG